MEQMLRMISAMGCRLLLAIMILVPACGGGGENDSAVNISTEEGEPPKPTACEFNTDKTSGNFPADPYITNMSWIKACGTEGGMTTIDWWNETTGQSGFQKTAIGRACRYCDWFGCYDCATFYSWELYVPLGRGANTIRVEGNTFYVVYDKDYRPPVLTIVNTFPKNGDTNISADVRIVIDFSYQPYSSTITPQSFKVVDSRGTVVTGVTVFGSSTIFIPDAALRLNETYTVLVAAGIGAPGCTLQSDYRFTFATGSSFPAQ